MNISLEFSDKEGANIIISQPEGAFSIIFISKCQSKVSYLPFLLKLDMFQSDDKLEYLENMYAVHPS